MQFNPSPPEFEFAPRCTPEEGKGPWSPLSKVKGVYDIRMILKNEKCPLLPGNPHCSKKAFYYPYFALDKLPSVIDEKEKRPQTAESMSKQFAGLAGSFINAKTLVMEEKLDLSLESGEMLGGCCCTNEKECRLSKLRDHTIESDRLLKSLESKSSPPTHVWVSPETPTPNFMDAENMSAENLMKTNLLIEDMVTKELNVFCTKHAITTIADREHYETCIRLWVQEKRLPQMASIVTTGGRARYIVTMRFLVSSEKEMNELEALFLVFPCNMHVTKDIRKGSSDFHEDVLGKMRQGVLYPRDDLIFAHLPQVVNYETPVVYDEYYKCFFQTVVVTLDYSKVRFLSNDYPNTRPDYYKDTSTPPHKNVPEDKSDKDEKMKEIDPMVCPMKEYIEKTNVSTSIGMAAYSAACGPVPLDTKPKSDEKPRVNPAEYIDLPGLPPKVSSVEDTLGELSTQWSTQHVFPGNTVANRHLVEVLDSTKFRTVSQVLDFFRGQCTVWAYFLQLGHALVNQLPGVVEKTYKTILTPPIYIYRFVLLIACFNGGAEKWSSSFDNLFDRTYPANAVNGYDMSMISTQLIESVHMNDCNTRDKMDSTGRLFFFYLTQIINAGAPVNVHDINLFAYGLPSSADHDIGSAKKEVKNLMARASAIYYFASIMKTSPDCIKKNHNTIMEKMCDPNLIYRMVLGSNKEADIITDTPGEVRVDNVATGLVVYDVIRYMSTISACSVLWDGIFRFNCKADGLVISPISANREDIRKEYDASRYFENDDDETFTNGCDPLFKKHLFCDRAHSPSDCLHNDYHSIKDYSNGLRLSMHENMYTHPCLKKMRDRIFKHKKGPLKERCANGKSTDFLCNPHRETNNYMGCMQQHFRQFFDINFLQIPWLAERLLAPAALAVTRNMHAYGLSEEIRKCAYLPKNTSSFITGWMALSKYDLWTGTIRDDLALPIVKGQLDELKDHMSKWEGPNERWRGTSLTLERPWWSIDTCQHPLVGGYPGDSGLFELGTGKTTHALRHIIQTHCGVSSAIIPSNSPTVMEDPMVLKDLAVTKLSAPFASFVRVSDHLFNRKKYVPSLCDYISRSPNKVQRLCHDISTYMHALGSSPFAGLIDFPSLMDDTLYKDFDAVWQSVLFGTHASIGPAKDAKWVILEYMKDLHNKDEESLKRMYMYMFSTGGQRKHTFVGKPRERNRIMSEYFTPRATTTLWTPERNSIDNAGLPEDAPGHAEWIYHATGFDMCTAFRIMGFHEDLERDLMKFFLPFTLNHKAALSKVFSESEGRLDVKRELLIKVLCQEQHFIGALQNKIFGNEYAITLQAYGRMYTKARSKLYDSPNDHTFGMSDPRLLIDLVASTNFMTKEELSIADFSPSMFCFCEYLSYRSRHLEGLVERLINIKCPREISTMYMEYVDHGVSSWRAIGYFLEKNENYRGAASRNINATTLYSIIKEKGLASRADGREPLVSALMKRKRRTEEHLDGASSEKKKTKFDIGGYKNLRHEDILSETLFPLINRYNIQSVDAFRSLYDNIPHDILGMLITRSGEIEQMSRSGMQQMTYLPIWRSLATSAERDNISVGKVMRRRAYREERQGPGGGRGDFGRDNGHPFLSISVGGERFAAAPVSGSVAESLLSGIAMSNLESLFAGQSELADRHQSIDIDGVVDEDDDDSHDTYLDELSKLEYVAARKFASPASRFFFPRNPCFQYDLEIEDVHGKLFAALSMPSDPDNIESCQAFVYDICTLIETIQRYWVIFNDHIPVPNTPDLLVTHPWLGSWSNEAVWMDDISDCMSMAMAFANDRSNDSFKKEGVSRYMFYQGSEDNSADEAYTKKSNYDNASRVKLWGSAQTLVKVILSKLSFCIIQNDDVATEPSPDTHAFYHPLIISKGLLPNWSHGNGVSKAVIHEFFRIYGDAKYGFCKQVLGMSPGRSSAKTSVPEDTETFVMPQSVFAFHPDVYKLDKEMKDYKESDEQDFEGASEDDDKHGIDYDDTKNFFGMDYPGTGRRAILPVSVLSGLDNKRVVAVLSSYRIAYTGANICHNTGPRYLPSIIPAMLHMAVVKSVPLSMRFHPFLYGFGEKLAGIVPTCKDFHVQTVPTSHVLSEANNEMTMVSQVVSSEQIIIPVATNENPLAIFHEKMMFSTADNIGKHCDKMKFYANKFFQNLCVEIPALKRRQNDAASDQSPLTSTALDNSFDKSILKDCHHFFTKDFADMAVPGSFVDFMKSATQHNMERNGYIDLLLHVNYPTMEIDKCKDWQSCRKADNEYMCHCSTVTEDCSTTRTCRTLMLNDWYINWGIKFGTYMKEYMGVDDSTAGTFSSSHSLYSSTLPTKSTLGFDIPKYISTAINRCSIVVNVPHLDKLPKNTPILNDTVHHISYLPREHVFFVLNGYYPDESENKIKGDKKEREIQNVARWRNHVNYQDSPQTHEFLFCFKGFHAMPNYAILSLQHFAMSRKYNTAGEPLLEKVRFMHIPAMWALIALYGDTKGAYIYAIFRWMADSTGERMLKLIEYITSVSNVDSCPGNYTITLISGNNKNAVLDFATVKLSKVSLNHFSMTCMTNLKIETIEYTTHSEEPIGLKPPSKDLVQLSLHNTFDQITSPDNHHAHRIFDSE